MMHNLVTRRVLLKAIGCVALPLALAGCQHTHVASTQVALDVAATQPATTEVVVTDSGSPPTTQATSSADNAVAQAPSGAGHGVAQVSRETYHAAADGVRSIGSSTADITLHSTQRIKNTPPESLSAPVIDIDEAMQVRDWDQVTASYPSGGTVAGPIGYLYQPRDDQPLWHQGVIEMPLFFVNTVLMPCAFFDTPPWKPVAWKAATVEPTYTGVPPLPPE